MNEFSVLYDDSVLLQAGVTRDEFEREAKLLMAATRGGTFHPKEPPGSAAWNG